MVIAAGHNSFAPRIKRNGPDASRVSSECPDCLAGSTVPEFDCLVKTSRCQIRPDRAENGTVYVALMALKRRGFLVRLCVPEFDGPVPSS